MKTRILIILPRVESLRINENGNEGRFETDTAQVTYMAADDPIWRGRVAGKKFDLVIADSQWRHFNSPSTAWEIKHVAMGRLAKNGRWIEG